VAKQGNHIKQGREIWKNATLFSSWCQEQTRKFTNFGQGV